MTAVVVTAGVGPYLSRTLDALANQTRHPVQVLLVDVGGPAGARAELDRAFAGAVDVRTAYAHVPVRTFGEAVSEGLARFAVGGGEPMPWVWLLHDDSAPAPDALAELVRAVSHAPSVVVAGAKQRTWTDPERLLEVGVRTTRSGRRVNDVEPGELDQGQHDGRTDVLGVGIAGALVRRDVWDELGGTDPALGSFGDGLDLSRRARLAGHRVVVVPSAVVRHAQAGFHGLRRGNVELVDLDGDGEPDAADPRRSYAARRRSLVHARLVAAPWWGVPFVVLAALVAAPLRALGQVALSSPELAADELSGGWAALARPAAVRRSRAAAHRTVRLPRRTLWPLQASWREVWVAARDRRLTRSHADPAGARASELELSELAALARRRRATLAAVMTVLLVASVVALGGLLAPVLTGGRLSGGALAFATSTWDGLWSAATSGWVDSGLGTAGAADPLLRVLALPAALFDGSLVPVASGLLLGGVLLAGWSAWAASGAATRSVATRAWAALVWALAPPLLLAVASGRLGAVVAHIGLPLVALGVARALGVQRGDRVVSGLATVAAPSTEGEAAPEEPHPAVAHRSQPVPVGDAAVFGGRAPGRSVAALGGAALAGAVTVAGAPVLLAPLILVCVVVAVATGRRGLRVLLVPVPALVLLGPLLVEATGRGLVGVRVLLAEPGLATTQTPAGAVHRLLGVPTTVTDALVPAWVPTWGQEAWPVLAGGLVLVLAVLAFARGGRAARAVRVGWLVAAIGLASATVVAAVPAVRSADQVGPAWVGTAVSLALLGLLVAGLVGADGASARLATHAFGWRQPVAAGLVALAVVVVGVSAGSWVWQMRSGSGLALRAGDDPVVPAVAQQAFAAPAGSRVLMVAAAAGTDPVRWQLLRADGVLLIDQAASVSTGALTGPLASGGLADLDGASAEAQDAVALLAAGAGVDVSASLGALGVADVQVPALARGSTGDDAAGQARALLVARLDATAGLERVTSGSTGTLWRVAAPAADAGRAVVTSWARLLVPGADPTALTTTATAVASDGSQVDTRLEAADGDRVLVLAARGAAGWHAWIDGTPLSRADVGWRQGFTVPAGAAGHLEVRYVDPGRTPWLVAQGGVGLLAVLVALPLRRRKAGRG
ncbi:MAG: glycosyltransferase family 2 protein [Cellulomonas sp.]|nr:glycosyltransferase family 2 protein [Cellulomonas sp.]